MTDDNIDRQEYMAKYRLSPDQLVVKNFDPSREDSRVEQLRN
jgi:hypothetical protein